LSRLRTYLPVTLCNWPPFPPELDAINNADIDGCYTIHWSSITATQPMTYVLEEVTNSAFTGAIEVYAGADTRYDISGKEAGHYYYHVKVCDGRVCSNWSNVRQAGAWWEQEPNNGAPQANGPLISSAVYSGTFTHTADLKDYFYFDLSIAHSVEVWLTNIPEGCDFDLALRDADENLLAYSNNYGSAAEHIVTGTLPPGRYYIQAYYYQTGCTPPYHLRVVYE